MPGYGIRPANEGSGLLPWSWAQRQLQASRNFWVVTLWPDGRPHAMPVWGVWDDGLFWFTSAVRSRKALNIANDPPLHRRNRGRAAPRRTERGGRDPNVARRDRTRHRPRQREVRDRLRAGLLGSGQERDDPSTTPLGVRGRRRRLHRIADALDVRVAGACPIPAASSISYCEPSTQAQPLRPWSSNDHADAVIGQTLLA